MPTEAKNEKKRVEDDQDRGVVGHSGEGGVDDYDWLGTFRLKNLRCASNLKFLGKVPIEIWWQSLELIRLILLKRNNNW
jgi:hypothetical protein